ncbi:MAG TPA: FecR family protein [Spirochaetota bacterium]|nr:FecR family protein [Spirochaetota bacterium]
MKRILIFTLIILAGSLPAAAQQNIGRIVSIVGDVDITTVTGGVKFVPQIGVTITDDHRIRTGNRSYAELLLNDGSKLFVREVTVLNLSGLKMAETDPPTRIQVVTGKLRITMKKTFRSRSLVLRTPTAVAGVRGTDFGVVVGRQETKLVVFEGQVEVASSNKDVIKAWVVKEREEVSVKKDVPPTAPRVVPGEILKSWFDYYDIDERSRIIIRNKRDEGFLDGVLRKKDF